MTWRLWAALVVNVVLWGTVIVRPSVFGAALGLVGSLGLGWAIMGRRRAR